MLTGFTGSLFAEQEEMVEESKSQKLAAWDQDSLATTGENSTILDLKNNYEMI